MNKTLNETHGQQEPAVTAEAGGAGASSTEAVSDEDAEGHGADFADVDPFDPRLFAVRDTAEAMAAPKLLVTCRVGKPPKTSFVRAAPRPEDTITVDVLELEAERETYLVMASASPAVKDLNVLKRVQLTIAIDRQGNPFLWMSVPPADDGHDNMWHLSMHKALAAAQQAWVRVASNMATGSYDVFRASGDPAEPAWPAYGMPDFLRAGFGDRVISDAQHPVIRRLLGEL